MKFEQPPSAEKSKDKFPNIDPTIAKHLEKVDFEKLRDIFLKKIADLGLNTEDFRDEFVIKGENFKDSGRLRGFFTSGNYEKQAETGVGAIRLNKADFENFINTSAQSIEFQFSENKEQKIEQYWRDLVLLSLIHEETHALASETQEPVPGHKISTDIQSGYMRGTFKIKYYILPSLEVSHRFINEAVTDIIMKEVYKEYTQQEVPEGQVGMSRNNQIAVVENILEKIGAECGIEEEILLKVLQRGYFGGPTDLSGEKMSRLFGNVFPKDFEPRLKKMGITAITSDDVKAFKELLDQSVWTDKDRKRVRRWIMHVYRQMPASKQDKERRE